MRLYIWGYYTVAGVGSPCHLVPGSRPEVFPTVHVDTIHRWINERKIETIRTFGGHHRIHKGEVERMVAERRESPHAALISRR